MKTYQIRKITKKDLDQFFEVFSKFIHTLFPEYNENVQNAFLKRYDMFSKKRFTELVKKGDRLLYGAFEGDVIVGILDGLLPWGGVAMVSWLAVDPKHHKKGIARALLREYEKEIIKRGGHSIYLYSSEWNIEVYKKLGFEYGGKHNKGWFGWTDHYMTKLLQEPKEENYLK